MKKWKCTVCGYVHEGATPPDVCPICGVGPDKFVEAVENAGDLPKEKQEFCQQLLFNLSYGLYVVTARENDRLNGMLSNSFMQVTDSPLRGSVCLNKDGFTAGMVKRTGRFGVSVLSTANMDLVSRFGYSSGKTKNKFEGDMPFVGQQTGCPGIPDTLCFLELEVEKTVDLGSHWMFIGKVLDGQAFEKGTPMTYDYYRKNR